LFSAGFALVGICAASGLRLLVPAPRLNVSQVPFLQTFKKPAVWGSILVQVVVQFVMVAPMTGVVLAMQDHLHLSSGHWLVSYCIVSHVLCMFIPGFFTGHLIKRVGRFPIMVCGLVLQASSNAVCLFGVDVWNFFVGMILLGSGWNFAFVSSTTLLIESIENHSAEERVRVTSANETLRFLANAIGALLSSTLNWNVLNYICLALLATVLPVLIILHSERATD
jgi:MFS family permease